MPRFAKSLALASLVVAAPAWPGDRLTDKCRTNFETSVELRVTPEADAAILKEINGRRRTELFERLWEPVSASSLFIPQNNYFVILGFIANQDVDQIIEDLRADPVLAKLGVTDVSHDSLFCYSPSPPAAPVTLTEFHNARFDRYYLAPTWDWVARSVPRAPDGPEWKRTGEVGHTFAPDYCNGFDPVFGFYSAATRTQVLTDDPVECGALRQEPRRWGYLGEAFGAALPIAGQCYGLPVWRLHDPRSPLSERLVWRPELRTQMMARGWIDDGLAYCFNGR